MEIAAARSLAVKKFDHLDNSYFRFRVTFALMSSGISFFVAHDALSRYFPDTDPKPQAIVAPTPAMPTPTPETTIAVETPVKLNTHSLYQDPSAPPEIDLNPDDYLNRDPVEIDKITPYLRTILEDPAFKSWAQARVSEGRTFRLLGYKDAVPATVITDAGLNGRVFPDQTTERVSKSLEKGADASFAARVQIFYQSQLQEDWLGIPNQEGDIIFRAAQIGADFDKFGDPNPDKQTLINISNTPEPEASILYNPYLEYQLPAKPVELSQDLANGVNTDLFKDWAQAKIASGSQISLLSYSDYNTGTVISQDGLKIRLLPDLNSREIASKDWLAYSDRIVWKLEADVTDQAGNTERYLMYTTTSTAQDLPDDLRTQPDQPEKTVDFFIVSQHPSYNNASLIEKTDGPTDAPEKIEYNPDITYIARKVAEKPSDAQISSDAKTRLDLLINQDFYGWLIEANNNGENVQVISSRGTENATIPYDYIFNTFRDGILQESWLGTIETDDSDGSQAIKLTLAKDVNKTYIDAPNPQAYDVFEIKLEPGTDAISIDTLYSNSPDSPLPEAA